MPSNKKLRGRAAKADKAPKQYTTPKAVYEVCYNDLNVPSAEEIVTSIIDVVLSRNDNNLIIKVNINPNTVFEDVNEETNAAIHRLIKIARKIQGREEVIFSHHHMRNTKLFGACYEIIKSMKTVLPSNLY